jgi:hypothetical protein
MNSTLLLLCTAILAACPSLLAQQRLMSPRDTVALTLDTDTISIHYGRPSMRGRKIMGELVPWNTVWRTGANEATHLTTNFDMVIGGVPLMRGNYTLWTIPSPTGWKFIINKETGQWGTSYDEGQDYARFDAAVSSISTPVETLTIALEAIGKSSGTLKLSWENTEVSTTFEKSDKIRPVSPLDSTSVAIKGATVKARYSKPFMRGRKIWGAVVPMDSVWRTGANDATVLETDRELCFGKLCVPKGTYTLYSIPTEKTLTLIVSKRGPGEAAYDTSKDLVRIEMKRDKPTSTVDPFTIWLEKTGTDAGRLKLGWDDRVYTTDFKIGKR